MRDAARLPDWPRGLREELAAEYVGLAVSTFRREVALDRAPQAVKLTLGRQVWLREDLDSWLDRKANRPPASTADATWDEAIARDRRETDLH